MYKRLTLGLAVALVATSLKTSLSSSSSSAASSSAASSISSSSISSSSSVTLDYDNDRFEGIYVKNLPCCKSKFKDQLEQSLKIWKDNNRRGVWLKIPVDKIDLTSVAIDNGFTLHSCEKDYLMLTKWLPNSPSTIPNQPHNLVGVGCICYDKKNRKLLVVKEKNGAISDVFKIPTGAVDPSEDLSHATERELLEETGIKGKFKGIILIRHAHGFLNNKSDLFFMCVVEPLSTDIQMCENELIACEWIDIEDYLKQQWFNGKPLNEKMNDEIKKAIDAIENNTLDKNIMKEHILENGWRPGTSSIFSFQK